MDSGDLPMNGAMQTETDPHRILVLHSAPDVFRLADRKILAKLGYAIVSPEEFDEHHYTIDRPRPDLRIVDERQLADVLEDGGPTVPIVALTGRHGVTGVDSRIVAALPRPPGMHDVYRVAQQLLEDTPRATPRVPVHLSARCFRDEKEWLAVMLSLSENGCLLRTPEPLMLGSMLEISFDLPRGGQLRLHAENAYQLVPDFGLIFHATSPSHREAIRGYVGDALTSL
jgi:hypothetical protein